MSHFTLFFAQSSRKGLDSLSEAIVAFRELCPTLNTLACYSFAFTCNTGKAIGIQLFVFSDFKNRAGK